MLLKERYANLSRAQGVSNAMKQAVQAALLMQKQQKQREEELGDTVTKHPSKPKKGAPKPARPSPPIATVGALQQSGKKVVVVEKQITEKDIEDLGKQLEQALKAEEAKQFKAEGTRRSHTPVQLTEARNAPIEAAKSALLGFAKAVGVTEQHIEEAAKHPLTPAHPLAGLAGIVRAFQKYGPKYPEAAAKVLGAELELGKGTIKDLEKETGVKVTKKVQLGPLTLEVPSWGGLREAYAKALEKRAGKENVEAVEAVHEAAVAAAIRAVGLYSSIKAIRAALAKPKVAEYTVVPKHKSVSVLDTGDEVSVKITEVGKAVKVKEYPLSGYEEIARGGFLENPSTGEKFAFVESSGRRAAIYTSSEMKALMHESVEPSLSLWRSETTITAKGGKALQIVEEFSEALEQAKLTTALQRQPMGGLASQEVIGGVKALSRTLKTIIQPNPLPYVAASTLSAASITLPSMVKPPKKSASRAPDIHADTNEIMSLKKTIHSQPAKLGLKSDLIGRHLSPKQAPSKLDIKSDVIGRHPSAKSVPKGLDILRDMQDLWNFKRMLHTAPKISGSTKNKVSQSPRPKQDQGRGQKPKQDQGLPQKVMPNQDQGILPKITPSQDQGQGSKQDQDQGQRRVPVVKPDDGYDVIPKIEPPIPITINPPKVTPDVFPRIAPKQEPKQEQQDQGQDEDQALVLPAPVAPLRIIMEDEGLPLPRIERPKIFGFGGGRSGRWVHFELKNPVPRIKDLLDILG